VFLNKFKNSSFKGQLGENRLFSVLTQMYSTAEIIDTTGQRASGDFIMKRQSQPTILIENKDYDRNINPDEIKKFIRDVEEQQHHGIFLSQHSGITSKSNYFIELHKGQILVYIHNTDYNPDKIKVAVDIIDNLHSKFNELNLLQSGGNGCSGENINIITKEVLDDVNTDYQTFIIQKTAVLNTIKESHKKILQQFDNIKLPNLEKYLSTKYAIVKKKNQIQKNHNNNNLTCDICNIFIAKSRSGLTSHKKKCNPNKQTQQQNTKSSCDYSNLGHLQEIEIIT
jgi:hypothetical protein